MSTSDVEKLQAGKEKVTPVWQLRVDVEPMINIGNTIHSAQEKYPNYSRKMLDARRLRFEVLYDDIVVGTSTFDKNLPQQMIINLEDTREHAEHALTFRLSGKTNAHSCIDNNNDVSWVLKFNFWIEQLPMAAYYSKLNSFVIGQNSSQSITIKTPIYAWLLENYYSIIQDYQLSAAGQDVTI